ncbi:NAD(P)-dependent oxidoreductase [Burkholderia aenigmatica]|nr:NAD(P)-binding domain-containing protein [Burkholderia aenigmatica]
MSNARTQTDITILGLGAMGSAYAREFVNAGKQVTVWNRSPGKADKLVRDGAHLATDVKAAISASPVTILAVVDHDSIRRMLSDDVLAESSKRTLVDLTTGTEAEFAELAARTANAGIAFLAGAVLAYPRSVGKQDTAVFYSGDAGVFDHNKTLLSLIGGTQHYVGSDLSVGVKTALAIALMGFVAIGGFFEAVAFAEKSGVPVAKMSEYIRTSGIPWMSECMTYLGERIATQTDDGDQATIDLYVEGFASLQTDLHAANVSSRAVASVVDYVQAAQQAGLGSKGLSALYDLVRSNKLNM